jgi:hypothetical protein
MMVEVTINSMESGRLQVCCAQPGRNGYVLTYPSATAEADARKALLSLGIKAETIADRLRLLAEIGPKQPLLVEQIDISQDALRANGFTAV